ncbi:D-alanyl-D-alanine carboxypeptidase [Patescibacteria group bacterium]|nr:MAG: D-alanyl-D-alanine carboxypeptidase [Patescibacteria group bacterium]
MIQHRNLILAFVILFAMVGTILTLKVIYSVNLNFQPSSGIYDTPTLKVSPSFFDSGKAGKGSTLVPATPPRNPSDVTARAYLVGDVRTGRIYIESNAEAALPVASMSKLVTAFVATDELSPTTIIRITPEEMNVASDTSRISAGESFTLPELLYPLLLNSSNVAAEALASSTNRTKFLELMSSYAWEIGMPMTFFADPSGLNPQNQASARDLFALARYLYKFRPDILSLTRNIRVEAATTSYHGAHEFLSTHPFVSDPRFVGGKTGRTPEAGETMLTILNINGTPVAFIVLGSVSREGDTRKLIAKVVPN